jgi:adenine deaminase
MMVDLRIKNGNVYNTFLRAFQQKDVYIKDGRFLHLSDQEENSLTAKRTINVSGMFVVPGLIDCHMHIESSMTVPTRFSREALKHGVTTVVADPHEIANVFGLEGIKAFMNQTTQLDIFYGIPSSVPATSESIETTGGSIGISEIEEMLAMDKVVCLGEVMNFNDLISSKTTPTQEIIRLVEAKAPHMPIEGHCPKISGLDLSRLIFQGVDADHTQQTPESIYEKITNGMFLEIQGKSITRETIQMLLKHPFQDAFALVTDDVMADHLLTGHLNGILRKAMEAGMPVEQAIYAATYTPAKRMRLDDRGVIAPGKIADFIVLSNLDAFEIHQVYKKGNPLDELDENVEPAKFPAYFYDSVKCRVLELDDLKIPAGDRKTVTVNAMGIQKIGTFTQHITQELAVVNGYLDWETSNLSLILVMERYGKTGEVGYGFVVNALTEKGAIATTWSHDHHNLMVMGTNASDMLLAQKRVLELKGGYVVVRNGGILAEVSLEVGGIVSEQPIPRLGRQLKEVRQAMIDLGYRNTNEVMSFSTLSLPVSPEIKITDKGMIDTRSQKWIPLILEDENETLD